MKRLFLVVCVAVAISGCSHIRMGLFLLKDNPTEGDPNSVPRGKVAFAEDCAQCHGTRADGAGTEANALTAIPTNILSPDYTKSAARIAAHIAYGKGAAMPAFVGTLSDEAIWDTANYLRSLRKRAVE